MLGGSLSESGAQRVGVWAPLVLGLSRVSQVGPLLSVIMALSALV